MNVYLTQLGFYFRPFLLHFTLGLMLVTHFIAPVTCNISGFCLTNYCPLWRKVSRHPDILAGYCIYYIMYKHSDN